MGIDITELQFLQYAHTFGDFNATATLGRQEIFYERNGEFAENLLTNNFGSSLIHSYDCDDYEGATHICDFNYAQSFPQKYHTIFDGGTLEHIFNIAQALENINQLCEIGGQVLHVVPSNNLNGHGFYQFTSDLFYSWYNAERGYVNTQVFYADVDNKNSDTWWYAPPVKGQYRQEFNPGCHLYLLCRTVKSDNGGDAGSVHATDYQFRWKSILGDPADVVPVSITKLLHP